MRAALVLVVPLMVAGLFGATPSASADKILFTRLSPPKGGVRMWVMRSDGTGARRLPNFGAKDPDLSLDGRRLVWRDPSSNGLATGTITGRRRRVVWRRDAQANVVPFSPRWSRSGDRITATLEVEPPSGWDESSSFSQVFVLRADGARRRRLSTPVSTGNPDWSPDGRRIVAGGSRSQTACTGTPPFYLDRECTTTSEAGLWVIEVASGAAREILHVADVRAEGQLVVPRWSPDGRTIAFVRYLPDNLEENAQLWTVRPNGSGLRQLTNLQGGAQAPSWSPDGRRLAFTTRRRGGRSDVATIRADGSGLRILTHSATNVNPDWSR